MSTRTTPTDDSMIVYEVNTMLSIQKQLYSIPVSKQTPEFFHIVKEVNAYLHRYCKHEVVHDIIDIDPDRSKSISYCTICGNTL